MNTPRPTCSLLRAGRAVALALVTALALVAGPVQAEEVETNLTGDVLIVAVSPTAPAGTEAALQAMGVVVGASASISYRVESTTPPVPADGPLDLTYYEQAITAMTVQIGDYSMTRFLPEGFESLNLIQIGDNVFGVPPSDSMLLSTPATESSPQLHGAEPGWPTIAVSVFDFSGPNASNDDGVIQDALKYDFGNAVVGGVYGTVNISLDLNGGGPGGGGPGVGPGFCRKGQLLAASKLGRKALLCVAKRTQQPPEKDPLGEKQEACLDKVGDKFELQFGKTVFKTFKKGGTCFLNSLEADNLTTDLLDGMLALAAPVLADGDPDDKNDRVLRAKLLKAMAGQWAKDANAYAKDALKPSATKLAAALGKSSGKLEKQVAKAISAAEKKGIVYAGPDGPALVAAVREAVEGVVLAAGGAVPLSD